MKISRGRHVGRRIYVTSSLDGQSGSLTTSSVAAAPVSGSRSAIVIRVNLANATVPSCSSDTNISNYMWGRTSASVVNTTASVDKTYLESSYGLLGWKFDVDANGIPDIYTVTIAASYGTTYDYTTWASQADSEAQKLGSTYRCISTRFMSYQAFPPVTGVAWPTSMAVSPGFVEISVMRRCMRMN